MARIPLFLDIETLPAQSESAKAELAARAEEQKALVAAPANYKDPAKIAEYIEKAKAEIDAGLDAQWRKTTFDGALGEVCIIGFARQDGKVEVADSVEAGGEDELLMWCYDRVEKLYPERDRALIQVVGHRVADFDLRFMLQRSVIHRVRVPQFIPFFAKPWEDKIFDTMLMWAGIKGTISLDKLCRALGVATKGSEIGEDIDGSKVWDLWKAGRRQDLKTYCGGDVERVREVWQAFMEAIG